MAEEFIVPAAADKKARYAAILPQIRALVGGEKDLVANLSNIVAALKQAMHFFWVGVYLVKNGQLVLGPFQGPVACTRIPFGKGVCGMAWREKRMIVVPDVTAFPGHIACSTQARSEIVIPVFQGDEVALVLDIDSDERNAFNTDDEQALSEVALIVERVLANGIEPEA